MSSRLAYVLSSLVVVATLNSIASGQQPGGNVMQRVQQRYDVHDSHMRPEAVPELDERPNRQVMIAHDVQELSSLSSSLQSDLQQLQKGMLVKDLSQKLKKMEKLSKRLRQEFSLQF